MSSHVRKPRPPKTIRAAITVVSKVILVTTAFLLVLPALYFYCFEFTAGSARQRILLSMFQSVTPRTAGFNTADLAAMGSASQALQNAEME